MKTSVLLFCTAVHIEADKKRQNVKITISDWLLIKIEEQYRTLKTGHYIHRKEMIFKSLLVFKNYTEN